MSSRDSNNQYLGYLPFQRFTDDMSIILDYYWPCWLWGTRITVQDYMEDHRFSFTICHPSLPVTWTPQSVLLKCN